MAAPRAVLFDIGSTLWSSPPEDPGALRYCYGRAREALLSHLPVVPPIEALIEAVEGYFAEWEELWRVDAARVHQPPTTRYVAEALKRDLGLEPPPEALRAFTDELLETSVHTAKTLPPEPGMAEALGELRRLGLRLGCVSNAFMGASTLHRIMEERGLGKHLELTVSSCEVGIRKPHPFIYEEAVRRLGLSNAEVIFVGDRLDADVAGPAKLGMRTVLTHQYRKEDPSDSPVRPDAVIGHLSELAGFVEGLLRREGGSAGAAGE